MDFETLKTEYEQLEKNELSGEMQHVHLDDERVEYWVSELKTRLKQCEEWLNSFNLTEAEEESWRVASYWKAWDNYLYFKNIKTSLQDAYECLEKSKPGCFNQLSLNVTTLIRDIDAWTNREKKLIEKCTKRPWSRTGNPYCVRINLIH